MDSPRYGRNWQSKIGKRNANWLFNNGPRYGGSASPSALGRPSSHPSLSQTAIVTHLSPPSFSFSSDKTLEDLFHASLEASFNIILGLFQYNPTTNPQAPPQYSCRDKTLQRMKDFYGSVPQSRAFGCRSPSDLLKIPDVSKMCRYVHCYTPKSTSTNGPILDRFSVISVPAFMDFDESFNEVQCGKNTVFMVHHIAAINIGEKDKPKTDFDDYCKKGSNMLDEARYVQDMRTIFRIALATQLHGGNRHVVWFPLGMGAFLRYLPTHDVTYKDPLLMRALRFRLAESFVHEVHGLCKTTNVNVHLCIGDNSQEAIENAIAFMSAIAGFTEPLEFLNVWWNADAAAVAQYLANECLPNVMSVSLVNGGNAKKIGNHWFEDSAMKAIDENLHRRSLLMSLMAFLVNGVHSCTTSEWVARKLDGRCYQFDPSNSSLNFTRAVL